jgi:hypothetical protein
MVEPRKVGIALAEGLATFKVYPAICLATKENAEILCQGSQISEEC